jgi:hypothetical protein
MIAQTPADRHAWNGYHQQTDDDNLSRSPCLKWKGARELIIGTRELIIDILTIYHNWLFYFSSSESQRASLHSSNKGLS